MKPIISTLVLVLPLAMVAQTPILVKTFPNPTPGINDYFSWSVAALGSDRVLIGAISDDNMATNAGIAYLFHTNGTLLTTFTNPSPAYVPPLYPEEELGDWFGYAIAPLGNDRVLVGAPFNEGEFCCAYSGTVYVFNTNGTLVTTIHNPNYGNNEFGTSVATLGHDRIIISAPRAGPDPEFPYGEVYLMDTNGALLATFYNPNEQILDEFGFSTAAFGTDRVLVGSRSRSLGLTCLFNTNGTLLMTFTNPAPANGDYFGHAVAAIGTDSVAIGAPLDDRGATDAGAVYIFNTNGTLLTTITNPTPAQGVGFGAQIVVRGNDRLVISAPLGSTTGFQPGSACVLDINGTLLATINNPTPAIYDAFGWSMAAFGSEGVIIGTPFDDTGATNAGTAYLFSIPSPPTPPSLTIQRTTTNTVVVSWPSTATGFVLQQNTNGLKSVNWSNVTAGVQTVGTNQTLIVNPIGGSRFYRLVKP
jgi:FG-GAP repeat protein